MIKNMKKLAVTAMAALILVGCSSSQHISSRGNDRTSYEQLGAVYKGRTFMRMPLTRLEWWKTKVQ